MMQPLAPVPAPSPSPPGWLPDDQLTQEWLDRKPDVLHDRRGKRIAGRCALVRIAEVVVLVRAIVNPEARPDGRFPLETRR